MFTAASECTSNQFNQTQIRMLANELCGYAADPERPVLICGRNNAMAVSAAMKMEQVQVGAHDTLCRQISTKNNQMLLSLDGYSSISVARPRRGVVELVSLLFSTFCFNLVSFQLFARESVSLLFIVVFISVLFLVFVHISVFRAFARNKI